jgi:hypothetical protein
MNLALVMNHRQWRKGIRVTLCLSLTRGMMKDVKIELFQTCPSKNNQFSPFYTFFCSPVIEFLSSSCERIAGSFSECFL